MSKQKRILLTGGAGFIGSHVAERLVRDAHTLSIIDNFDSFYPREWKERNLDEVRRAGTFDLHEADIRDVDALRRLFEAGKFDCVIHLAALAGVRPSIERPLEYEKVNVAGTANLLELCREFRIARFVFGSSSSVYGATSRVPFSEDHVEGKPISPYAATKLAAELLCHTYAHLFQLECVCLRFFTVYGPRQRPDLAIRKFVTFMEEGKPLPFFGDGTSGRDYTYVDDIVEGVVAAMNFDVRSHSGEAAPFDTFNLGNSSPVSLSELVSEIEIVTGLKATLDRKPFQAGDVPITCASTMKAERLLGFKAKTPFREGLERFVEWYRNAAPDRYARTGK